jgi:hypothetical protein
MKREADGKATCAGKLRSAPQRLQVFERPVYPAPGGRQIDSIKRLDIAYGGVEAKPQGLDVDPLTDRMSRRRLVWRPVPFCLSDLDGRFSYRNRRTVASRQIKKP